MPSLASQTADDLKLPPISAKDLGVSSDGTSSLDAMLKQQVSSDQEYSSKVQPINKKLEDIGQKIDEQKTPGIPTLTPVPKPEYQDPLKTFGSAAGWIATFGGLLTRQPLKNSLNAAASVINAQREGDQQKFKDNMEIWKAETDNAIKLHQFEMDAYKAVMDKYGAESENARAELQVLTSAYKNTTAQQMLLMRAFPSFMTTMDKQQDHLLKSKAYADWMALNPDATNAQQLEKWKELNTKPTASSEVTLTHDAIEKAADSLKNGVKLGALGLGYGKSANKDAVMNRAAEKYPDLDLAKAEQEFAGGMSEARSVGSQAAKIELASNMLDQSLPSMMKAAEKVGLSPSTDLNTVYNTIKRHGSDQDFSNFSTQLRAVTSDYAQFIGRGKMTVHSDDEALRILNENMGPTSLQGFVDAVNTERKNVGAAIDMTKGKKSDSRLEDKKDKNDGWKIEPVGQ